MWNGRIKGTKSWVFGQGLEMANGFVGRSHSVEKDRASPGSPPSAGGDGPTPTCSPWLLISRTGSQGPAEVSSPLGACPCPGSPVVAFWVLLPTLETSRPSSRPAHGRVSCEQHVPNRILMKPIRTVGTFVVPSRRGGSRALWGRVGHDVPGSRGTLRAVFVRL